MDIGGVGAQTNSQTSTTELARPVAQPAVESPVEKKAEFPTDTFVRGGASPAKPAIKPAKTNTTGSGAAETEISNKGASSMKPDSADTLLESTGESTSTSGYTEAEIEKYDTNGDSEIDSSEELKMKLDEMRERYEAASVKTNQVQAMKAYKTAMKQGEEMGKLFAE